MWEDFDMTCDGVERSFVGRAQKLVAFTALEWTFPSV